MSCPFCNDILSGYQDSGRLLCLRCGLFHQCIDGPVKSNTSPWDCERCAGRLRPSASSAASPSLPGTNVPSYCPFCQGAIESDTSGNGYRCFRCGPWHLCNGKPVRAAAAMCNYCSARSTRSSRHALPHPQPMFQVGVNQTPRAPAWPTAPPPCPTCHRPF